MNLTVFLIIKLTTLAVLLAVAVITDLRSGKIYNKLTIPCIILGLLLNTISDGQAGLAQSVMGVGLVLLLYLVFAPAAGVGGGDIKLMMAIGAVMGLHFTVWAMLFSAVIGGIMALVVMARHKALLATTRNVASDLYLSAILRSPINVASGSKGIKFRYSPAIALGTLLAILIKL